MIVSQPTIARITSGRQRRLWLPVERGTVGELLPCPLQKDEDYSLQPAAFAKGVAVTVDEITRRGLLSMTDTDARALGVTLPLALSSWARDHGENQDQEVWVIAFTLGRHAEKRRQLGERYLNRKLNGRDYTDKPGKAARGEGAALSAAELELLGAASERRASERDAELRAELASLPLEQRLARLEELAEQRRIDLHQELRAIRHRVEHAEHVAARSHPG